jgi:DNA-directed RNA polymerase subunit alpha
MHEDAVIICEREVTEVLQKNWQELIKPSKLEVVPGTDPSRQASVVAEPLERGFGLTLGNALRRICCRPFRVPR